MLLVWRVATVVAFIVCGAALTVDLLALAGTAPDTNLIVGLFVGAVPCLVLGFAANQAQVRRPWRMFSRWWQWALLLVGFAFAGVELNAYSRNKLQSLTTSVEDGRYYLSVSDFQGRPAQAKTEITEARYDEITAAKSRPPVSLAMYASLGAGLLLIEAARRRTLTGAPPVRS